jgi:hypothetical protein
MDANGMPRSAGSLHMDGAPCSRLPTTRRQVSAGTRARSGCRSSGRGSPLRRQPRRDRRCKLGPRMLELSRPVRLLAASIALIAGFVDAIGFVGYGGTFVSFMSGNSTRIGAQAASVELRVIGLTAAIVAAFVGGVAIGQALGGTRDHRRRVRVLSLVALSLAAAAWVAQSCRPVLRAAGRRLRHGRHQYRLCVVAVAGRIDLHDRNAGQAGAIAGPAIAWRDALPTNCHISSTGSRWCWAPRSVRRPMHVGDSRRCGTPQAPSDCWR